MRLFFVLWPPAEVAAALATTAQSLAKTAGGRPTRKETLHLTLAFLGDVDEAKQALLMQAASAIHVAPFTLSLDQVGYWPHNNIAWAGCSSNQQGLLDLANELRQSLAAFGFHAHDAGQDFIPHVTLVRDVPVGMLHCGSTMERVRWPISGFVLVRSRLSAAGPAYETLSAFSAVTDSGRLSVNADSVVR